MLNTANYNKLSQVSSSFEVVFQFRNDFTPCIFSLTLPLQRLQQLFSNIILYIAEQTKTKFSTKKGGKKRKKEKKNSAISTSVEFSLNFTPYSGFLCVATFAIYQPHSWPQHSVEIRERKCTEIILPRFTSNEICFRDPA